MEELRKLYAEKFKIYGDTPQGVQWSNLESQEKRFRILLEIGDIGNSSVLDYGCGTGHLATYLRRREIQVAYTGVDLVDEFLQKAKEKHPEYSFAQFHEVENKTFDYVFISGVFNNKIKDNVQYYQDIIKRLFLVTNKGIAFNMMSAYVDYYDPDLFYEKPEKVFSFIKNKISPYVVIRNDYQIKPGVVPFEFCVYIYKK